MVVNSVLTTLNTYITKEEIRKNKKLVTYNFTLGKQRKVWSIKFFKEK